MKVFGTKQAFTLSIAILSASVCAQAPGDRAPLKTVHPGYSLINLMPGGIQPGVSGIDFMSDGRVVICTWGGDHRTLVPPSRKGDVYLISGTAQDDTSKMTAKKIYSGLQEPLGLKVVNDTIYVSERQALGALADKNGNGVIDSSEYRKVASYADGGQRHEFFFGLVYKDGYFYGAHSLSLVNGGTAAVPQPESNRGTYVKIDKNTGKTEFISGGAREPFGITMNPAGEIFSTEVQGTWNPANAFTQVLPGKFYGHPQPGQVPANVWDTKPYQAPAVLLPETEISNAPGEPAYIPDGPFKGQYFMGDVTYGGIHRVYLEKVDGNYQGGVVRFTAGLQSGVSRLKFAPNGDLIVGEIGDADGNWNEPGKKLYGLQKLKANGKSAFEILSVRSRPKGMELEFTQEVALDAEQASKYQVQTWTYTRTATYGGPKVNQQTLTVSKVQVDATRKKVYLEINGLVAGEHIVYIHLNGLTSSTGAAPWSTETWYTLNAFGTGDPFTVALAPGQKAPAELNLARIPGALALRIAVPGAYDLRVVDSRGAEVARFRGEAGGSYVLPLRGLAPGVYAASLRSDGRAVNRAFTAW